MNKRGHFWTTYPPHLIHVVFDDPNVQVSRLLLYRCNFFFSFDITNTYAVASKGGKISEGTFNLTPFSKNTQKTNHYLSLNVST